MFVIVRIGLYTKVPCRTKRGSTRHVWQALLWSLLGICSVSFLAGPLYNRVAANSCTRLSPCQKFGYSEAIFVGRMIGGSEPVSQQVVDGAVISRETGATRFSVEEVFKGSPSPVQMVEMPRFILTCGGGRVDYSLIRGERYLVFARRSEDQSVSGYGALVSEAGEDLEFLRGLPAAGTGGTLSGRLYGSVPEAAITGIAIE